MIRMTCLALPPPAALRRGILPRPSDPCDMALAGSLSWPEHVPIITSGADHPAVQAWSGRAVQPDDALRDCDCGYWAGKALHDLPADQVVQWLGDPAFAPPGGESRAAMFGRVTRWMAKVSHTHDHLVVAVRPAVVRAMVLVALGGTPAMESRLDIVPATRTMLVARDHWRVQSVNVLPG
ncbi:putative phosphoglycerate mutase [Gluconacetobacter diazotrophicus PA1 5]|uniref:Histidine phosphatase family protein n=3 Tax=Gluconacetobacter diazotrophicus TaxID=33996 RepID=A0A7W4NMW8_GLUDI|nr:histidine phosphatase family protein [Gluconacetobacter diazotrophicus]ACI51431.1 putative phosphoglycerate mutase [Gluconacetobacter diazotrophicus PA1 5]MBB2157260.1 histidine phosphatase family protein [Gluconacetobacter diazotrophicus]CAP53979.1 putative phosphoglycerate mutase [Gluconacetobacter diazotrophicus PA1 5]